MGKKLFSYPFTKTDSISKIYLFKDEKVNLPMFSLPVSAGNPTLIDDYLKEYVELSEFLGKEDNDSSYLLKVSGESMSDVEIHDGDNLIISTKVIPVNGDIIVASVNGSSTVKTLKLEKDKIFLVPENKNFKPIEIDENTQFRIDGVVISMIRRIRKITR